MDKVGLKGVVVRRRRIRKEDEVWMDELIG